MAIIKLMRLQSYKIKKNPNQTPLKRAPVNGNNTFNHIPTSVRVPGSKQKLSPAQAWPHLLSLLHITIKWIPRFPCGSLLPMEGPLWGYPPAAHLKPAFPSWSWKTMSLESKVPSHLNSNLLKPELLWLGRLLQTQRPQPPATLL